MSGPTNRPTDQQVIRLEQPVAWGEQDAFGHLNNVVYFRYFENVRMYFLERVGILRSHQRAGIGVILAHTSCQFERPVKWPMQLAVVTWCSAIGTTSFTLAYEILDER
ncbi:MAG: acyl-CoA thioesterase, partial [Flavobacteriales bacterium]|nr:acyl-CoA thioesterase [Flavobacteriales bacterium]